MPRHGASGADSGLGVLLRRLRQGRGLSQMQLAGMLRDLSGRATVSRHELSRWERGERVPGRFWLGWLSAVLDAPLEDLEAAADAVRVRSAGPTTLPATQHRLWRPPVAVDLLAALDHGTVHDVRGLAHAWLAGPPDGWRPDGEVATDTAPEPDPVDGGGQDVLRVLEARLARLRQADDLVGGLILAGRVDRRLREAVKALRRIGAGRLRGRALRAVAGYAQLAGWVHADAGHGLAARRAYRVGLRAATVAGDRELAAYVLGSLSSLSLAAGDVTEALVLARTGLAGLPADGSALTRALLLHRAALAAARCGDRPDAEVALAAAERTADRAVPGQGPEWLRWLDPEELAAMTGRCLVAAGRPLRAVGLLQRHRPGAGRRSATLYGCWLARCYLLLGEVEEAGRVVTRAHTGAVAAGSDRAAAALRHVQAMLAALTAGPAP